MASSSISTASTFPSSSSTTTATVPFELPAPTYVGPSAEDVSQGVDLSGKTVVITGANSGLGKESARVFLLRGAFVVLGVRKVSDGEQVVAEFAQSIPNAAKNSVVLQLDLADDKSIVRFASEFASLNRPIHVLLLNAGILSKKRVLVPWNQSESQFAVNHLGHFLLTQLLLNAVIAAGNARVVVLSSVAHAWSGIQFDDINFSNGFDKLKAYGQSKTANILFAKELNRRFEASGLKARANAVHPGVIATKMANTIDPDEWAALIASGAKFRTVGQGAATSVWAAVAPELEGLGGLYLEDARISQVSTAAAADADAAARLWQLSEELVRPAIQHRALDAASGPAHAAVFASTSL